MFELNLPVEMDHSHEVYLTTTIHNYIWLDDSTNKCCQVDVVSIEVATVII